MPYRSYEPDADRYLEGEPYGPPRYTTPEPHHCDGCGVEMFKHWISRTSGKYHVVLCRDCDDAREDWRSKAFAVLHGQPKDA